LFALLRDVIFQRAKNEEWSGRADLNLRRLAGVNETPQGGEWEPAAEILSRAVCGEGSPWRNGRDGQI